MDSDLVLLQIPGRGSAKLAFVALELPDVHVLVLDVGLQLAPCRRPVAAQLAHEVLNVAMDPVDVFLERMDIATMKRTLGTFESAASLEGKRIW